MTAGQFAAGRISAIFAMHRPRVIVAAVIAVAYLILLTATYLATADRGAVVMLLVVGVVNVTAVLLLPSETALAASIVFAVAMIARSVAALVFQREAVGGDPFLGSPDAWNYHTWAVRLAGAFHDARVPSITSYDQTGRFDVGYYYVLGIFYFLFGASLFIGRLAGALFGALAAMMLLLVARRVAAPHASFAAAMVYALWPMSIGWSSETILRDAFIWFLLLAGTWVASRLITKPNVADWCSLVALALLMRYTRPYAAFFLYAGLGITFALALLDRSARPRVVKRSLPVAGAVLAAEILLAMTGFPNVLQTVRLYKVSHWVARPLPAKTLQLPRTPQTTALHGTTGTPDAALPAAPTPIDTTSLDAKVAPKKGASLPGNAVRLLFGPFGWTFMVPGDNVWPVWSVWVWYAILPAAAIGAFVLLRRGSLMGRALVVTTGLYLAILLVVGRGDAYRQRETAVPFVIAIAFAGILKLANRRKILVPAYVAWSVLLLVAMTLHVHALRKAGAFSARLHLREAVHYVTHQSPPPHHDA